MKSLMEKYKGKTFAEAAEAIGKKYKDRETNSISKNSYEAEITALAKEQEVRNLRQKAREVLKYGGSFKKAWGGTLDTIDPNAMFGDPPPGDTTSLTTDNELSFDSLSAIKNAHKKQLSANFDETVSGMNDTTLANDLPEPRDISSEGNIYKPAIIGKGIEQALNASQLLGGSEKERPNYNPYEQEIKNTMAGRDIDRSNVENRIMAAYNSMRANANNTRSANVRDAFLANAAGQTQKALAENVMQEEAIEANLASQYAQTLDNLGRQRVQADTYTDDINARNRAAWQNELSKFGVSISDIGKFATTLNLNEAQTKIMANVLDKKYETFGVNPELMARTARGEDVSGEWLRIKQEAADKGDTELSSFADFMSTKGK